MSIEAPSKNARFIKQEAKRIGFLSCGISKAGFLEQEAPRLENWLNHNMHGEMQYMENHFDKRLDPTLLVPGARSVVSLLLNYYTSDVQEDPAAPKISKYAYGQDYHHVIKGKLNELLESIRNKIGHVEGRVFVDSAPVLDKAWAARSGLGWIGKHSNLLTSQVGSFYFIAELIIDLDLEQDSQTTDHCGTCTACIDACPTQAIEKPYVVNGSKCISYFTIELKESFVPTLGENFDNWMFGCDVCQDVCPWNRFSQKHKEKAFEPHPELLSMTKQHWQELTNETFNQVFKKSAVKRTKYQGLMRNIQYLDKKRGND